MAMPQPEAAAIAALEAREPTILPAEVTKRDPQSEDWSKLLETLE